MNIIFITLLFYLFLYTAVNTMSLTNATLVIADIINPVIPTTSYQLWFMLMAFSASMTLFKKLDYDLQQTEWFKALETDTSIGGIFKLRTTKLLLDLTHHWWAGLGLMTWNPVEAVYWTGAGLLVADMPDFKRRLDELLKLIGENLAR